MTAAAAPLRDMWTASPTYRQLYQSPDEIETVTKMLEMPAATALVDVGCGNGAFLIAAARANPTCRILAYDALQSAVDACRVNAARELGDGRVTCAVAPAEKVPLPDGSVDRVLCRAVLHHLADPHVVYREFARVLGPGGMLLLQAPCNYWQQPWGQVISDLYLFDDDTHRRQYHQPADVIAGLNAAGLAMRDAECWPYPHKNLKPAAVAFIQRVGAAEQFELTQASDGSWSCRLYWLRVRAIRL